MLRPDRQKNNYVVNLARSQYAFPEIADRQFGQVRK